MATKEQRNQFAKETRDAFKKAIADFNFKRADAYIQDMKGAGFKAIAAQMQKTRDEALAVDEDASKE